jgi:hypothetical protein
MLYMVIEHFAPEKMNAMADRFRQHGRLLPDGVVYKMSWIDESGTRCYQVMEAEDRARSTSGLRAGTIWWISKWCQ